MITLQDIYDFAFEAASTGRSVAGSLRYTGLRPTFMSKFARRGVELPACMSAGDQPHVDAPRRLALR